MGKFDGQRFLSPEELKKSAEGWKKAASGFEPKAKGYITSAVARFEGAESEFDSIDRLHYESLLDYIEILVKKKNLYNKNKQEKIKILDIGAGAGLFAEQIRKKFGTEVKVYTTGLTKKAAKSWRGQTRDKLENDYGSIPFEIDKNNHPDDLKWRSVSQLSDYPEFDLIIDTYGENLYDHAGDDLEESAFKESKCFKYLEYVISKLKPGGMASIVPFFISPKNMEELRKLFKEPQIVFDLVYNSHQRPKGTNPDGSIIYERGTVLKISKNL